MKRSLPPYCHQKPKAVYFQRRGWETHRFIAEPLTPEFWAEYALVLRGTPPVAPGGKTFLALVRSYQRSRRWNDLAPRTKDDYQKVLTWVEEKLGPLPPAKMQMKDVIRAQMANADRVRFANYIVQVLRVLMIHARELGWREDNPTDKVQLLRSNEREREPWPAELIAAYREAAPLGSRERTLLELGIGTGQRPNDLTMMRWDAIKDGGIYVTQGKTKAKLWVPLTRDLRAALDAVPRTGLTICADAQGRPTTYRRAAELVLAVRKRIGAEDYDMHSWRYTAAAQLAEAGCTDEQIASITGHKSLDMVRKYAGAARQISRAKEAQKRRE